MLKKISTVVAKPGHLGSFLQGPGKLGSFVKAALHGRKKEEIALAGNRTRVNCLEGSYAHHYTTNARLCCAGAATSIQLLAHMALTGESPQRKVDLPL